MPVIMNHDSEGYSAVIGSPMSAKRSKVHLSRTNTPTNFERTGVKQNETSPDGVQNDTGYRRSRRETLRGSDQKLSLQQLKELGHDVDTLDMDSFNDEEGDVETEDKGFCKSSKRFFKQLIPFILLLAYSLFGALAFYHLERETEMQENRTFHECQSYVRIQISQLVKEWRIQLLSNTTLYYMNDSLFISHQTGNILMVMNDMACDPYSPGMNTFLRAVFFTGTIYTTIGYGNIAPKTTGGRLLTIVYSILGIPIMFFVLHKLGRIFCALILHFWDLCTRAKRMIQALWSCSSAWKKASQLHVNSSLKMPSLTEADFENSNNARLEQANQNDCNKLIGNKTDDIGITFIQPSEFEIEEQELEEEERHLYDVPVTLALALTLGWMLMCSGLFLLWETKWTYFTSFYFFFISLTTIGLGDVVPEHIDYMILNFPLVIIGLSLVTMCINLIQVKLEHLFQETMMMIMKKYQEQQARGESGPLSEDDLKNEVFGKFGNKWMQGLMKNEHKNLIAKEIKVRASMIVQGTQTDKLISSVKTQTPDWLPKPDSSLNLIALRPAPIAEFNSPLVQNRKRSESQDRGTQAEFEEPIKIKKVYVPLVYTKERPPKKLSFHPHTVHFSVQPSEAPIKSDSKSLPPRPPFPRMPTAQPYPELVDLIPYSDPSPVLPICPPPGPFAKGFASAKITCSPKKLLPVIPASPEFSKRKRSSVNIPPVVPISFNSESPNIVMYRKLSPRPPLLRSMTAREIFDIPPIDANIPLPEELYSLAHTSASVATSVITSTPNISDATNPTSFAGRDEQDLDPEQLSIESHSGGQFAHDKYCRKSSSVPSRANSILSSGVQSQSASTEYSPRHMYKSPVTGSLQINRPRTDRFYELMAQVENILSECQVILTEKDHESAHKNLDDLRLQYWFIGGGLNPNPGRSVSRSTRGGARRTSVARIPENELNLN